MSGVDIFDINRHGPFSLADAQHIIAIIKKFTSRYKSEVNHKINQLEAFGVDERESTARIESEVEKLIEEWNSKVKRLGAAPKGLWIVDVDSGDGYFCWKYPENEIKYWHDYKSGYTGRRPLVERYSPTETKFDSNSALTT
jgi:hypothetical protein